MKSQLNLKKALITLVFVIIGTAVFAQTGKISGKVSDKKTGETLIGVTVKIAGSTKGAATDVEGKYLIGGIASGKYTIEASYVGYTTKAIVDVEVKNGASTVVDLILEESNATQKLNEVVVTGQMSRETETSIMLNQKNSAEIKQGIGIQELSRKGVSDVEEGLTKITGITKVDGRGLFVRGLEDRYNNLLINGLAVPSNNPFKKIIPLDVFPTDIVSVLETYKTFNSSLYGDFAGGTFNIVTSKGEKAQTKINIGTSFTSNSNLKRFLKSKDAGSFSDFLGFPGTDRELPKILGNVPASYTLSSSEALSQFGSGFDVEDGKAPLNTSFGILHTQKFNLDNQRSWQYLISLNTDNNFQIREGVDRFFNTAQGIYDNNLYTTRYRFSTNSSLLGALNYKSERLNLSFNTFYLKSTENMIQDQLGYTNSQATVTNSFIRLNQLTNSDFLNSQLFANYKLTKDNRHSVRAGVSYSKTKFELPDRKSFKGSRIDESTTSVSYSGNSIVRQYMDFDGSFYASGLAEYNWRFGNDDITKAHKLSLGYNGSFSKMESNFRFLISQNLASNNVIFNTDQPDTKFTSELSSGNFSYREGSNATYKARMQEGVNAGYGDLALKLGEKTDLNAGIRFEQSQRITRYRNSGSFDAPFEKIIKDNFDILPSLNFKYALNDKANFRVSASKTLTKPVIMEAFPLEFVNPDATIENGNPNVINSKNYNLDVKYELFPTDKEMIAVTGFAKYLDSPIERLFLQSAGSGGLSITYNNSKKAVLYGAELEFLLQLSRVSESLSDFSVGFNTSLMVTETTIDKIKNSSETAAIGNDNTRRLQGASPWLINADIKYETAFSKKWKNTMTLAYNVYGERIYAVGTNGLDHYYEKPFGKLDFIWNNKISDKWDVKFGVENILNPLYKVELGDKSTVNIVENDLTVKDFKRGVGFSLNLGYTF
ncbi:TonB-dependent receptor [Pedobacter metabolipauper]|uniref:Outer membrane receptor protein involved in Fe transport n=1 Tax=Pedobacter metabolipauper TaxID=425513 RepID=A0A4R6SR89_9SPHI|nr:TonB-dependent receptor [Pedobacter metabolipauper]TDQ07452.1 outer membrane receptor protein involved in Fe transport [Pedobacter metabolipauper]